MSTFSTLRACIVLSALLLVAGACVVDDIAVQESDIFTCEVSEDCLSGFSCINGVCVDTPTSTGECDDLDNDGVGVGANCFGEQDCDDSNSSVHPANGTIAAAAEDCDGLDNDCNGSIDDGIESAPCENTKGVCSTSGAIRSCVEGAWVPADCETGCPGPECLYGTDYAPVDTEGMELSLCGDGLDNNCDGEADEGCPTCTDGEACGTGCLVPASGQPVPEAQCACKMGERVCSATSSECIDPNTGSAVVLFLAQTEIPGNGMDDDCDGKVD